MANRKAVTEMHTTTLSVERDLWERFCEVAEAAERKPRQELRLVIKAHVERHEAEAAA